jgi:hypothetical protein
MPFICFTLAAACKHSDNTAEPVLGLRANHIKQQDGYPELYIPEFSNPTGKYVSRLLLSIFNAFLKKRSLVFAGNPCTPGMSVLEENQFTAGQSFLLQPGIQTVVCNFWGTPKPDDGIVFPAEPYMLLVLKKEWKNLEDYKQAMHSKYRIRVNKALQCSEHLKTVWQDGDGLSEHQIDCMAKLLADTLANKTLALPPDLKGLIRGFCKTYGNRYQTVFCLDENDQIVGFLSAVKAGETVFAMHIGYDAEKAKNWHLYQRLMLDLIAKNVGTDILQIQLGRTATEIKSTLGAEPMPNSIVIFTNRIYLKFVLKFYRKYFFKPKSYVLRRPFRAV